MADVHNKKTRSYNMSMIRSKDTPARPAGGKPEILVRKFLFAKGFRYKIYDKTLPASLIPTRQYFLIWVGNTYSQFSKLMVKLTPSEY